MYNERACRNRYALSVAGEVPSCYIRLYTNPKYCTSIIGEILDFQPERFITYILFDKSVFLC